MPTSVFPGIVQLPERRQREMTDDSAISLAYLPATARQRRVVLVAAALLVVAFAVTAPFAATRLPRLDAFIPTVEGMILVNDLITSILLFAQYSVMPSRAVLALAAGYLFTALSIIPHLLNFPGAFAQTGLLPPVYSLRHGSITFGTLASRRASWLTCACARWMVRRAHRVRPRHRKSVGAWRVSSLSSVGSHGWPRPACDFCRRLWSMISTPC